jgi:PTS system N-acetylglucosamine-specific IIA component
VTLSISSPLTGTVVGLDAVPDPVFAQRMVGPGTAIKPEQGPTDAVAPIAGTIAMIKPHAYVIQAADGKSVLVHLGIDTVQLKGEGFTVHKAAGDVVSAGDPVISWNPAAIEAGGKSSISPVVALDGGDAVTEVVSAGAVSAGDSVLTWA